MKKHKKLPEVRKQEYLDTALDLFVMKGYFKTTVQEIIDRMGASKGAFYHYFKSKEDIIHVIIEVEIQKYNTVMREIVGMEGKNAIEKFREMLTRFQAMRHENMEKQIKLFKLMESKENALFYQQMIEQIIKTTTPYYRKIIIQGNEEGTFHVEHPAYTTEMIMYIITYLRRKMVLIFLNAPDKAKVLDEIKEIILFMDDAMHKILGVAPGTLNIKEEYFKYLKS
ncbi:TetR/AcrR family transcriptional regulator [Bacteroidota bacterium]